jgi:hypothetical protein
LRPLKKEFKAVYCNQIHNDTAKMAFHLTKHEYTHLKYVQNCSGIFMDQLWMKRNVGIVLRKNHFLLELAEDVLQHTISAGIPQHSVQYHNDFILKIDPEVDDNGPKVLAMKDLSFGFNIVLIALGISAVAFVLELVYFQIKIKIRRNTRQIIGKTLVFMLVKQWLERYRQ